MLVQTYGDDAHTLGYVHSSHSSHSSHNYIITSLHHYMTALTMLPSQITKLNKLLSVVNIFCRSQGVEVVAAGANNKEEIKKAYAVCIFYCLLSTVVKNREREGEKRKKRNSLTMNKGSDVYMYENPGALRVVIVR